MEELIFRIIYQKEFSAGRLRVRPCDRGYTLYSRGGRPLDLTLYASLELRFSHHFDDHRPRTIWTPNTPVLTTMRRSQLLCCIAFTV